MPLSPAPATLASETDSSPLLVGLGSAAASLAISPAASPLLNGAVLATEGAELHLTPSRSTLLVVDLHRTPPPAMLVARGGTSGLAIGLAQPAAASITAALARSVLRFKLASRPATASLTGGSSPLGRTILLASRPAVLTTRTYASDLAHAPEPNQQLGSVRAIALRDTPKLICTVRDIEVE